MVVKTDGGYFIKGRFVTHLDNQSTFDIWDKNFKSDICSNNVDYSQYEQRIAEIEKNVTAFCENIKKCKIVEEPANPFTKLLNNLTTSMLNIFK